jgi:hypothetical protein
MASPKAAVRAIDSQSEEQPLAPLISSWNDSSRIRSAMGWSGHPNGRTGRFGFLPAATGWTSIGSSTAHYTVFQPMRTPYAAVLREDTRGLPATEEGDRPE